MRHHAVWWISTDVSEELTLSIKRIIYQCNDVVSAFL
jgi:hypothetical protein